MFSQVFGPFLPLRAADQIHTDIAYNDVKVRLIGTHSGVTAAGGPTHNDIADLALYRAIPNLTVCVPADAGQCKKIIRASMDYEGPMIIRIDRAGSPNVYADDNYEYEIEDEPEREPVRSYDSFYDRGYERTRTYDDYRDRGDEPKPIERETPRKPPKRSRSDDFDMEL